jgi:asparagine synthase (glutamine-hydrolysing)
MMRRHVGGSLRTFSIGFSDQKFNELTYARQVATQFETDHQEFVVEPDAAQSLGLLAWHFDEPFADSSALPTYYLSKMTRQHVTVALNGDGGDESFAGYERYRGIPWLNCFSRTPAAVRSTCNAMVNALTAALPANGRLEAAQNVTRMSLMDEDRQYVEYMVRFREAQKRQLFTGEFLGQLTGTRESELLTSNFMHSIGSLSAIDRKMAADIEFYLPGALLPKVDRMTMANSLEGRSPLLDHKLMEFAARLSPDLKLRNNTLKYLLKKAALTFFPETFVNRPKQGFEVPLAEWLRGPLRGTVQELLSETSIARRGILNPKYVRRLVGEHEGRVRNHHYRIWSLLMFEAWARTFIDRADPLAGPMHFGV